MGPREGGQSDQVKPFWILDFRFWIGKSENKRVLCFALAASMFALCPSLDAQQPAKTHRIGFLSGGFPGPTHWTTTLRTDLRDLGYVESKNIIIESRFAENKPDRLPALADELVRLKVDIIVAGGTNDARAAKNATKTISIVTAGIGIDPVEAGLVESLARPGGNITGLTNLSTELVGKRLELLKEAVAKVTRVAVLYDPAAPGSLRELKETLPPAADALGLTVRSWGGERREWFRENIRCAKEGTPRWTLRGWWPANES
jgi:putative ABC transport system substrate-binding protein